MLFLLFLLGAGAVLSMVWVMGKWSKNSQPAHRQWNPRPAQPGDALPKAGAPTVHRSPEPSAAEGPSVVFSGGQMVVDLPAKAPSPTGNPEFDAVRRQMTLNQWDEARRQLQQVAYGMVDAPEHAKDAFTELMKEFAARDPLFSSVLRTVMPLVRAQPGMLQSGIYKHLPGIGPEEARYALYFGEQLGVLRRVKKGNSYRLYEPGAVIEAEEAGKSKPKRAITKGKS